MTNEEREIIRRFEEIRNREGISADDLVTKAEDEAIELEEKEAKKELNKQTLSELRKMQDKFESLEDSIQEINDKIDELKNDMKYFENELNIQKKYDNFEAAAGVKSDIDKTAAQIDELKEEKEVKEFEKLKMERDIDLADDIIEQREARIEKLINESRNIKKEIADLKENHEKLGYSNEDYIKAVKDREDRIDQIHDEIALILGKRVEYKEYKDNKQEKEATEEENNQNEDKTLDDQDKIAEEIGAFASGKAAVQVATDEDIEAVKDSALEPATDEEIEAVKNGETSIPKDMIEPDNKGKQKVTGIANKLHKFADKIKANKAKIIGGTVAAIALVGAIIMLGPVAIEALGLSPEIFAGYVAKKAGVLGK